MGKLLKVLGTIILCLVILLGAGGYFFVKNFDLNKYKSYASTMVEKEIGRKLVINGNASLGISLIPTLIIEDVELSNAPWANHPQMVKIKKLEIKFALVPLLSKEIEIDKVILISPEIFLEVAKDGKANWDFNLAKTPKVVLKNDFSLISSAHAQNVVADDSLGALSGLAVKDILIENGVVKYTDHSSNGIIHVDINKVELKAPSLDSNIDATFDMIYDKQNIVGNTTLGSVNSLLQGKNPYNVYLSTKVYGVNLEVNAAINDIQKTPSFAADINAYNPAGNMDAPEITLKSNVSGNEKLIHADIKLLNVVNNVITGKVKVNLADKRPNISLDLNSNLINLQNFNKNSNFALVIPSLISSANASTLVPDTAIPYAEMNKLNANVLFNVKKLIVNEAIQADNVLLNANLQNGLLNVNLLKLNFDGGDIEGNALVNANNQSIKLNMFSKNIALQNVHQEFKVENPKDFGVISGGQMDITANLTSAGATYRQVVQNLNGQAIAIVDKSVIQTGDLRFMTGNFLTSLLEVLPLKRKEQKLDVTCAVVRADFKDGKAFFPKGIAIQSKELSLVSDGKINLVNDKVDFSLRPFSGKVVDANVAQALSSFIKIKGTIESPQVAIDDKQAIKALVGVATTGGVAYLGSKMVLDADSSPCYTALQGTAFQNRFPAPNKVEQAGQEAYQKTSKQIDDDIKVLKNTAKDFLKGLRKDF